jgi:hypothetical protein
VASTSSKFKLPACHDRQAAEQLLHAPNNQQTNIGRTYNSKPIEFRSPHVHLVTLTTCWKRRSGFNASMLPAWHMIFHTHRPTQALPAASSQKHRNKPHQFGYINRKFKSNRLAKTWSTQKSHVLNHKFSNQVTWAGAS